MARLGLKELRNAANPARESVADAELGLYGTATQAEINGQRGERDGLDGLRAEAGEWQAEVERQGRERGGMER
jgi:hypothetical protein